MGINFSRLLTLTIWKSYFKFSEQQVYGDLRRPCHDLRAWHGGAQRTGDPKFCEDTILPGAI